MNYTEDNLYLFDSDMFDFEGTDRNTYRVCLEGIDEVEALEEAFRLNDNGDPVYPMIFDKITTDNPELITNCSYVLRASIQNTSGKFEGVGLAIVSENWWISNSFHVNELAVSSELQNIGIGTLLMKKIIEDAFISNKDAVTLQCYEDDEEALNIFTARYRFYISLGFSEIGNSKIKNLMCYPLVPFKDMKWKATV